MPKTKHGNIYVLVTIDHYSKWCKTKAIIYHDRPETTTRFIKEEVICKFRVLKYNLTNNGFEWSMEFDQSWKKYSIIH
jgi:hypothetical protein